MLTIMRLFPTYMLLLSSRYLQVVEFYYQEAEKNAQQGHLQWDLLGQLAQSRTISIRLSSPQASLKSAKHSS
jgi:hypothetical protein